MLKHGFVRNFPMSTWQDNLEQRAELAFEQAMLRPPEDRNAFALECCRNDENLLERVLQLIEHAPDSFTEEGDKFGEFEFDPTSLVDTTVDRFTITEFLGEGGFGAVFLAQQHEPMSRQVAIKVVKRRMNAARVLARFDRERKALGILEHPGTARLIDGGLMSTGHPYFVMEFVEGDTITDYCASHECTLKQRIGLALQLCDIFQHVHTKGIVHRDVKPSNVLVRDAEHGAMVKVVDFGISSATGSAQFDSEEDLKSTNPAGTPAYMSPEQAKTGGEQSDTRSDVYSIGAVIYELLTGAPPIPKSKLSSLNREELENLLLTYAPVSPSEKCNTNGSTFTTPRILAGDLDWIVMKCLSKSPDNRYQTIAALKDDLTRYLEIKPVAAAPISFSYRSKKWAKRNPGALVSIVLGSIVLLVSLFFTTSSYIGAETKRIEAEKMVSFLVNMIRSVDPEHAKELDKTLMIQMLEDAEVKASSIFEGSPASEGKIRDALGRAYQSIGLLEIALSQAKQATELLETAFGSQNDYSLNALSLVGSVLSDLGRNEESLQFIERAYQGHLKLHGPENIQTLKVMRNLGSLLANEQRFEESEKVLNKNVELFIKTLGGHNSDTLNSMHSLAALRSMQGKNEEALELHEKVLLAKRDLLGDDHPQTLNSINSTGIAYVRLGRIEEAEPFYKEAIELKTRILGEKHPKTLASMMNFGNLLLHQGKFEEAIPLLEKTLKGQREVIGDSHVRTLFTQENLTIALVNANRPLDALPYAKASNQILIERYGEEDARALRASQVYGSVLISCEHSDDAIEFFPNFIEVQRKLLPANDQSILMSLSNLGLSFWKLGRFEEAEPLYRECVSGYRETLGNSHQTTMSQYAILGSILGELEQFDEAISILKECVSYCETEYGIDNEETKTAKAKLQEFMRAVLSQ